MIDPLFDDDEGEFWVVFWGNLPEGGLDLDDLVFHHQAELTVGNAVAIKDDPVRQLA